jgi:hypothetical protein
MTEKITIIIKNFIEFTASFKLWKAVIAFLVSGVILIGCLFNGDVIPDFIEYIVYAATFYFLVILGVAIYRDAIPWALRIGESLPIIGNMIRNIRYRQRAFLYFGGLMNMFYLVFYFVVAFIYKSRWFYVIGMYNLCIAMMRGYLSHQERKIEIILRADERPYYESKAICNVAKLLFLMNAITAIMGLLIIFNDETFSYHYIILYAVALYVFIRLIWLIVVMAQKQPHNTGIWKAVQMINFAVALVMLFTFQTALLHTCEADVKVREHFNAMTGGMVFFINLGIVIWLMKYGKQRLGYEKTE